MLDILRLKVYKLSYVNLRKCSLVYYTSKCSSGQGYHMVISLQYADLPYATLT